MTLQESLAQARADLAREVSNRSSAEAKLTEVCEARALLEKGMQSLEVRFQRPSSRFRLLKPDSSQVTGIQRSTSRERETQE